jgi:hypothetical protein
MTPHHVKITAYGLRPFLTKVEIDGKEITGILSLTVRADVDRVRLEVTMIADLEIEGDMPTEIRVIPSEVPRRS